MFEPRHVLIAVDTASSEAPVASFTAKAGINLAARYDARATFVSVLTAPPILMGVDTTFDIAGAYHGVQLANARHAEEALTAFVDQATAAGVASALEVVDDAASVPSAIAAAAERLEVDAVVLASHSRRGIQRLLLGSVAERVAHLASVPVLILRTPPQGG